jgi:hypothetical protein
MLGEPTTKGTIMRKLILTLAATAAIATLTAAPSQAADHNPSKCTSLTDTSSLCQLGKTGRLRVHMVEATGVEAVTAVKSTFIDSIRQVQPFLWCGNDGEGYALELAAIHPDATGVQRMSRFERKHFAAWAERYITRDTDCTLYGPM